MKLRQKVCQTGAEAFKKVENGRNPAPVGRNDLIFFVWFPLMEEIQLTRLGYGKFLIIYEVSYACQVVVWVFWTINGMWPAFLWVEFWKIPPWMWRKASGRDGFVWGVLENCRRHEKIWKATKWDLRIYPERKRIWSSEPKHHDFRFDSLIFGGENLAPISFIEWMLISKHFQFIK